MIWKRRNSLRYADKWLTIDILLLQIHQEINSVMTEIKLSNVLILILNNFIYVYILKVIKCLNGFF